MFNIIVEIFVYKLQKKKIIWTCSTRRPAVLTNFMFNIITIIIISGNARYGLCGFGLLVISYVLFFFNPVEIIKSAVRIVYYQYIFHML